MAAPTFQAAGTLVTSTGTLTPSWPTHQAGDIGLFILNHSGGANPALNTANGFAILDSIDSASVKSGTIYWCRATSSSQGNPTAPDTGDGNAGLIITIRGCVASGDPWDVFDSESQASTTAVSISSLTSTLDELLLLTATFAAHAVNDSTSLIQGNTVSNSGASNVTTRHDSANGLNNDGYCLSVVTSNPTTIGSTGATTWTSAIAARAMGHIAIAFKSPDSDSGGGGPVNSGFRTLMGAGK